MAKGTLFTTPHFLLNLPKGPISSSVTPHKTKKAFQVTYTLAFLEHLQVIKKMKCCEYGSRLRIISYIRHSNETHSLFTELVSML